MALLLFSCSGCSPVYLAKAGWAEMKILKGRRPFDEVINDPRTDEDTRRKLLLARQARAFAIHMLGLDAGDSYTSFTQLDTDTLAWVLSAAYKDRLESKTWWFPIVGRVPYKGYASQKGAEKAESKLEEEGFDTYLRTTSAFSTLGWFADPLLSSLLRYDDVELVTTIIHELSHNHLFVPGKVRFNESFATFVGRAGAIRFFCGMDGDQQTPDCVSAIHRMDDYNNFSSFLNGFVTELEEIYSSPTLTLAEKVQAREELHLRERQEWGGPRTIRRLPAHRWLREQAPQQRHPHGSDEVFPPALGVLVGSAGSRWGSSRNHLLLQGGSGDRWRIPSICFLPTIPFTIRGRDSGS